MSTRLPSSLPDLINSGITFANHAIQNDTSACTTNDPVYYNRAVHSYQRAIEFFTKATELERNAHRRSLINERVSKYRTRHSFMTNWLQEYSQKQSRQTEMRRVHETATANPVSDHQSSDPAPETQTDHLKDPTPAAPDNGVLRRRKPERGWDCVVGLHAAKETLCEALPTGVLAHLMSRATLPWRTVLLYGPSGAGKRLLVEATAKDTDAVWVEARGSHLPDIVDTVREERPEGERWLVWLRNAENWNGWDDWEDQIHHIRGVLWVFVTRKPWLLDHAVLRRMERRVYVSLLGKEGRALLMERLMRTLRHDVTLQEMEWIAEECQGMAGRDMELMIRDARMEGVRKTLNASWFRKSTENDDHTWEWSEPGREGAIKRSIEEIGVDNVTVPLVDCLDLEMAMQVTKPSTGKETLQRFEEFTRMFGMDGA